MARKKGRKGGRRRGLRGLEGLTLGELQGLAGDIARCVAYGTTGKGRTKSGRPRVRCFELELGPGSPNKQARAASGVTRKYAYSSGRGKSYRLGKTKMRLISGGTALARKLRAAGPVT